MSEHVLNQLKSCRTAQLGYHLCKCNNNDCMKLKYQYRSCRNRPALLVVRCKKNSGLMIGEVSYYRLLLPYSIHFTT
ncbi:MAG: transposase zinc-binding domain-containing protein [Saprospiraceae bacterium]|nr:transposase zinc-binding domain-containing protein [Saprospiraceae bacterium]